MSIYFLLFIQIQFNCYKILFLRVENVSLHFRAETKIRGSLKFTTSYILIIVYTYLPTLTSSGLLKTQIKYLKN